VTASRFSRARVFAGRPSGETPGREAALILRQPVEFKSQIAVRWSRLPAEQGGHLGLDEAHPLLCFRRSCTRVSADLPRADWRA
jgi:hypothetical protein